jgi:hypothetical protein
MVEQVQYHLALDNSIRRRVSQFIADYNSKQTKVKDRISCANNLAQLLADLYADNYQKIRKSKLKFAPVLPSLLTKTTSLAKLQSRHKKTVYNQILKLVEAGLILVNKEGVCGLECWINPEVLWISPVDKVKKAWSDLKAQFLKSAPETVFEAPEGKILQPLVTCNYQVTKEYNNSTVNSVDNRTQEEGVSQTVAQQPVINGQDSNSLLHSSANAQETSCNDSCNEGLNRPKKGQEPTLKAYFSEKNNKKTGGAGAQKFDTSKIEWVVTFFWHQAQQLLYPNTNFTPEESQKMLQLIRRTVYNDLDSSKVRHQTEKEWMEHHQRCMERLALVHHWLKKPDAKGNKRSLPFPLFYFDPANKISFEYSKELWLVKKTVDNLVNKQFIAQKAVSNVRNGKSRSKTKSRYQIYQTEFNRVSKLKDMALRQAFLNSLNK